MDILDVIRDVRGMITLGVVMAVDDTGQAQTVSVKTAAGAIRAGVEVLMPFGLSTLPPLDGAICLLFAVGADPANLRALPIGNPSARYGAQNTGESTLYAQDGTRVSARQGGALELWGGNTIAATTKTATVNATDEVIFNSPNVQVTEALKVGNGATGTFTAESGQTVTVEAGIIIDIS